jgi:glycosyltransferase involved in cell wall biosynthesis
MRIAYITAGAAGMFCGSCLKDNLLVATLKRLGYDAILIPTYTPIHTDEEDVSWPRVFLGGISVYLDQKFALFRRAPRWLKHLLANRWLLRRVSRLAGRTNYRDLGELTVSMLRGLDGYQAQEVAELAEWLRHEVRPDVIILTNALLSGVIPALRQSIDVPVIVTLQGDDIFLDALQAEHRDSCLSLIRANCASVAAFIATSRYYADYMADYLGIPRAAIQVIYPGISLEGCSGARPVRRDPPWTIGYFARICPEKGWHQLVEAYLLLRKRGNMPPVRLKVGGWLGANDQVYFQQQWQRLQAAGFSADIDYVTCPTHQAKLHFMQSLDLFCVPTVYREPKGLYLLEAWANGVPAVQPAHGAFPELMARGGGGILVPPGDPVALADALSRLLLDVDQRDQLGHAGATAVFDYFHAQRMAAETVKLLEDCCSSTKLPA